MINIFELLQQDDNEIEIPVLKTGPPVFFHMF